MNNLPPIEPGYVSPFTQYPANDPIQYAFPRTGNFIILRDPTTKALQPETLVLYDDYARVQHAPANVSLSFSVSSPREGKKKFPRPFVYEKVTQNNIETLKLVTVGEKLKITYINGNIKQPLVENAIESLAIINQENFLRIDESNLDRQVEKYETDDYVYAYENNGKGEFKLFITGLEKDDEKKNTGGTGNVTVDLVGTEGNGNTTFGFNGSLTLNQKNVDNKIIQFVKIDSVNKTISLIQNKDDGSEIDQSIVMDETAKTIKISDANKNILELSSEGMKINGEYVVLKPMLDWILDNATIFSMGNLGAPAPIQPSLVTLAQQAIANKTGFVSNNNQ